MDLVRGSLGAVASWRPEAPPPLQGSSHEGDPRRGQGLKVSPGRAGGARQRGRDAMVERPEMLLATNLVFQNKKAN